MNERSGVRPPSAATCVLAALALGSLACRKTDGHADATVPPAQAVTGLPYAVETAPSLRQSTPDLEVQFTTRLLPDGRGVAVDTAARTCAGLLRMVREGYTVDANVDWIALRAAGSTCAVREAVRGATPAARSAVRAFRLSAGAPDTLPAPLAVAFSRDDSVRAWSAEARGLPWRAVDSTSVASVSADDEGLPELRVEDDVAWNRVRVVARGDFTGDGLDDLLLETQGGAQKGSLVTYGVHVVTRDRLGERLRYVRRVW